MPLRLRSIQVKLDRPDFTINPTHCSPEAVTAQVFGTEGATAGLSNHFQAANCGSLGFAPKLTTRISNGTRRAHPVLTATLTANSEDANLSRVAVTLPKTILLDQGNIGTVCTRVQFAANACPARSVVGEASADTPLLADPLAGTVYLASSSNKLPDLLVALKGQININLRGRIDAVKGRTRTTFESIPDAPISSFTLKTLGGEQGPAAEHQERLQGHPALRRQDPRPERGPRRSEAAPRGALRQGQEGEEVQTPIFGSSRGGASMRGLRGTLALVGLLACMAFGVTQAQAAVLYVKADTFNGEEIAEEHTFDPSGNIAFHQAGNRVAVTSWIYSKIPVFDQDGELLQEITGESITPEAEFPRYGPVNLAIDNSGGPNDGYYYFGTDFWNNDSVVFVFDATGDLQRADHRLLGQRREILDRRPRSRQRGLPLRHRLGHEAILKYTPAVGRSTTATWSKRSASRR